MIEKNQDYDVDIIDMGYEGEGITKINGYTTFVKGALKGEKAKIKMLKVNKDYGFAKLLEVIEKSRDREEPVCENFSKCGGCNLQHMSYEAQLEHKENIVRSTLKKALGHEVEVNKVIGMGIPYNYRNKAGYPVVDGKIGFYRDRSHSLIENKECAIQNQEADKIARIAFEVIKKNGVPSYNEKTNKGVLRHIVTRIGKNTGETMLMLVTNETELKNKEKIVKEIVEKYPQITTIVQNINKENGNVILGEKCITLYGKGYIEDRLGDYKFKISPLSFYQVNPTQTEVLYNIALKYAGLTGKETVFDLYCGIGTISIFVAEHAKKVYGVEIVKPAVEDAKINAEMNEIKNAEFICGEAEKIVPEMYQKGIKADVVFIDPPRKGCGIELLETIVKMKASKIVYISCNVATLARDLKYLTENGLEIKEVQPVDMFPQTSHVETCVLLALKNQ